MLFRFLLTKYNKTLIFITKIQTRGCTKQKLTMNTAFFRHVHGEGDFHVSLRYVNGLVGIDKQFNFCRKAVETTSVFLGRLNSQLEKTLEKKHKRKKKKEESVDIIPTQKVISTMACNGAILEADFPCINIFSDPADYSIDILGVTLPIVVNAPWIEVLTLPKSIMAGFLVYPSKFESFFVKEDVSSWVWYRSLQPDRSWAECGKGRVYETANEDVGHYLRLVCEPRNEEASRSGPIVQAVTTTVVEAGPGPLSFVNRHLYTVCPVDDSGFRVVSYNILADLYADSDYSRTVLFGYCPAYALALPYRRQLLIKEILGYKADLISLQEVDTKVFKNDLVPILKENGMSGCFSQKGTVVNEGTAIFYNEKKFKLLNSWSLLLRDLLEHDPLFHDIFNKIQANPAFVERVMGRSTTLQVLLLECIKKPGHLILAANVHLYFHPDADHVRLFQGGLIVTFLQALLAKEKATRKEATISLVLCGDFNSVPECGVYELFTTGSVSDENIDWRSNEAEAISGLGFTHELKLGSACGTPPYTNYTLEFKACLDYIYYETSNLRVTQVVPMPSEDELSIHLAIPSVVFPSDHVALVCDLQYTT